MAEEFFMSETFWEPGTAEQAQPEGDQEHQNESQPQDSHAAPGTLALSVADFKSLEERILRAVDMVKRERTARAAAEERATQAEAKIQEQSPRIEQMEKELQALKGERDHVRQRVERLLSQLDALEV
jgi:septal ring factor EnvC (AmiA/AmiB activator)